ncbi:hypothetical protein Tco_0115186 [Tanacetum coccineum]
MCTYLKNMEGKKPKDLKNKSFNSIQKMFDRAFKRVNTFVNFRTDLVEGSSKRAGDELEQEVTKKQKVDDVQEIAEVDDDQETAKIKELMKFFSDEEEVAIDAIPLATKPPSIGDFETLWKLVKAKYGSTRLVEDLDLILYGDLKTMFEPHIKDQINIKFRGGLLGLKDFLMILKLLLLRIQQEVSYNWDNKKGVVELYFVNTKYQLADIFTKALGRERIEFVINKLAMRSFTPETLKQLADEAEE